MKTSEIRKLWKEVSERVRVSCDEYHPHSALQGCVTGEDPKDVLLCKLIETLLSDRRKTVKYIEKCRESFGIDDEEEDDA